MKIAYLVSSMAHTHCYGGDYLFAGLVEELGFENVLDWPEKESLHCPPCSDDWRVPYRDACQIESDQAWPRRGHGTDSLAHCDAAIVALHPSAPDAERIGMIIRTVIPRNVPIVAVDFSDSVADCRVWYEWTVGRRLAGYGKREYPLGANWPDTFPLPLSYPLSRVEFDWQQKEPRIFYHATDHGGRGPGIPRQDILEGIATLPGVHDVRLYPSQHNRLSASEYHKRMGRSLLGVSWNGAVNWDNNRFWENFAFGLCQVAQWPTIQIPHPPRHGEHVFYAQDVNEVRLMLEALLREPEAARVVARQGHEHYRVYHSSRARARQVLDVLTGKKED